MSVWQREPLTFSAGDTLIFERYLPGYTPSNGWALEYAITGGVFGDQPVLFSSAPDGDRHLVTVLDSVTAAWLPGCYVLTGYAVNNTTRTQVYYGEFVVTVNALTAAPAAPVTTHAQRMIPLIELQLEKLATHDVADSTVEQTEIRRAARLDLERQLALNKEIRNNEIACENVRNGRPSGNKIVPKMNVMPIAGVGFGAYGYPGFFFPPA